MLVEAFAARGVRLELVDDRLVWGDLGRWPEGVPRVDGVLLRSKSLWKNILIARWLEALGTPVVNPTTVIETCGDKVATTLALVHAHVPTVSASVALAPEGGRFLGDALGFPLVVKPTIGSWGRLIGRINDADALETVLDHKAAIGGAPHAASYVQRFVETRGSDIRSFVISGRCVAAIERNSSHWKTNTALGARASARPVDAELAAISEAAAAAVGGGAVAVDLFETEAGYLVNEVNGTMEFRNSVHTTGVDIPALLVNHVVRRCRSEAPPEEGLVA